MLHKSTRIIYFLCFLSSIIIGLASRKVDFVPLIMGDILYAVMSYWMFKCIFTKKSPLFSAVLSICFCFLIELQQMLNIPLLIELRNHHFFRLILGQGFLWTDLAAYVIGVALAYLIDKYLIIVNKKSFSS